MAESEREKALDAALGQIEKQFGKGSVMRMGDNLNMNIESVGTGALSLDIALGIGGLRDQQVVDVDADVPGVNGVHGVLGVDVGADAAVALRLGDHVHGEGGLS